MKPTAADHAPEFDRLVARGLEKETDAEGNACPDADLLAAWFDRSLSAVEASRIEAHAATCGVCQQILAALARSEPAVTRAAPLPDAETRAVRPWHWHWRWVVPAVTALIVVIVGTRTMIAPSPAPAPASISADARLSQERAEKNVPLLEAQPAAPAAPSSASPRERGQAADQLNAAATPESRRAKIAEKFQAANAPRFAPDAPSAKGAGAVPALPAEGSLAKKDASSLQRLAVAPTAVVGALPEAPQPPPPPAAVPGQALQPPARPSMAASEQASGGARPETVPKTQAAESRPQVADLFENVVGKQAPSSVAARSTSLKSTVSTGREPLGVTASPGSLPGTPVLWRFGAGGLIERSDDAGQTWTRQPSGVDDAINAGSAPSQRVCWLVGAKGLVLRTSDGRTWTRMVSPTGADLTGVAAWSETSARVTAADRREYTTTDGGMTWKQR